jgi:hypothetical protein
MRKILKWTLLAAVALVWGYFILTFVLINFFMFDGSMWYARKWKQRFDACSTLADITNRFEYLDVTGQNIGTTSSMLTLLTFSNDNWLVMRCSNSHGTPWGGTVVTRDSTAKTRVFFGHVCGSMTLRGNSLEEAYSNLVWHATFKEVFLNDK